MGLSSMPYVMAKCLILTIIFEVLIALLIGVRNKKDILNVILVNTLTNPLVSTIPIYIYIKFGYNAEIISLALLEGFAFFIEGYIYSKVLKNKINPYVLSLILNILSYTIGAFINCL